MLWIKIKSPYKIFLYAMLLLLLVSNSGCNEQFSNEYEIPVINNDSLYTQLLRDSIFVNDEIQNLKDSIDSFERMMQSEIVTINNIDSLYYISLIKRMKLSAHFQETNILRVLKLKHRNIYHQFEEINNNYKFNSSDSFMVSISELNLMRMYFLSELEAMKLREKEILLSELDNAKRN